jgi:hypothetical protein
MVKLVNDPTEAPSRASRVFEEARRSGRGQVDHKVRNGIRTLWTIPVFLTTYPLIFLTHLLTYSLIPINRLIEPESQNVM